VILAVLVALLAVITSIPARLSSDSHALGSGRQDQHGELNTVIDINTKGEIGLLAESIERMQVSIKAAIERLQKRREVK